MSPGAAPAIEGPVRAESLEDGKVWRVWLDAPRANIIDSAMIAGLTRTFRAASSPSRLRAIVLEGTGDHFSFGASVEEHLPENVGEMLPAFHALFRAMLDARVFTVAAVRGQCLGGGLELAAMCHRVIATPGSKLGQPEIVLGVIAPVASVLLAERCGRGAAYDLCLSGRTVGGEEAHRMGVVDDLAEDPGAAAVDYVREHMLPRSAASLRLAVQAAQVGFRERFLAALEQTERLYLHDLMKVRDAAEGIRAFVDKRSPKWSDR